MRCKTCGTYLLEYEENLHKCPPEFEVICDEYDPDTPSEYFAIDYGEAVEKWAEDYDSEDGPTIANGMGDLSMRVRVRKVGEEGWHWFMVSGEWVASYRAEEVK